MELTDQEIEDFQAQYREHSGEELSKAQAADYARRFLRMMEIIYTPLSTQEWEEMKREVESIRIARYGLAE